MYVSVWSTIIRGITWQMTATSITVPKTRQNCLDMYSGINITFASCLFYFYKYSSCQPTYSISIVIGHEYVNVNSDMPGLCTLNSVYLEGPVSSVSGTEAPRRLSLPFEDK